MRRRRGRVLAKYPREERAFHIEPDGPPIVGHGKYKWEFQKTIYTVPC